MTWKFFKQQNIPRSAIYRHIQKYGDSNKIIFNKLTRLLAEIATPKVINKVKNIFDKKSDIRIAAVSKKLNLKKYYLYHIIVNKLGNKARIKKQAPAYIEAQKIRCNDKLPNLSKENLRKIVVMYDKSTLSQILLKVLQIYPLSFQTLSIFLMIPKDLLSMITGPLLHVRYLWMRAVKYKANYRQRINHKN